MACCDSLGAAYGVPWPELLPIQDNIISLAFRDELYAPSVRLTQKYAHQAKISYLTSLRKLQGIQTSGGYRFLFFLEVKGLQKLLRPPDFVVMKFLNPCNTMICMQGLSSYNCGYKVSDYLNKCSEPFFAMWMVMDRVWFWCVNPSPWFILLFLIFFLFMFISQVFSIQCNFQRFLHIQVILVQIKGAPSMSLPCLLDHNIFPRLADFVPLPSFSRNNHYHKCDVFILRHVFIFLMHNCTSISDKYFQYAGFSVL